jgi:transposase
LGGAAVFRLSRARVDLGVYRRLQGLIKALPSAYDWQLRPSKPRAQETERASVRQSLRANGLDRFVDDGQLPVDNNWIKNQIQPNAIGRSNWLSAGTLRAGQRAAGVMSLVQSLA